MNRSEALAPLNDDEGRFHLTAGLIYRGAIRKAALKARVDFFEEKGFLESVFVFRGPKLNTQALYNFLKRTIG